MLRRVLTSKSLKYGLGLALLSHPPAWARFQVGSVPGISQEDRPKSVWRWALSAQVPKNPTAVYTGWQALHKAMTLPLDSPPSYIYEASSLPAIMLSLRHIPPGYTFESITWPAIRLRLKTDPYKHRPVGGY